MSSDLDRLIPLQGCFNFRDLGGYPGRDGRLVRWRTLFRSDGLHRLTAEDLRQVADLGIATVVDLRTNQEVQARGRLDAAHPVAFHHLPLIDVLPPNDEIDKWTVAEYVGGQYLGMLQQGAANIAKVLELLAEPGSYPALFHCMAGKDRTGIVSALVLDLIGVAESDIVADYALSAEGMGRMAAWLQATYPDTIREQAGNVAALILAEPAAMGTFLRLVREEYGSVGAFVDGIGLAGIGDRLASVLLEP